MTFLVKNSTLSKRLVTHYLLVFNKTLYVYYLSYER